MKLEWITEHEDFMQIHRCNIGEMSIWVFNDSSRVKLRTYDPDSYSAFENVEAAKKRAEEFAIENKLI